MPSPPGTPLSPLSEDTTADTPAQMLMLNPGHMVGEAVSLGISCLRGPVLWVGTQTDALDDYFLDAHSVKVIVGCKYPNSLSPSANSMLGPTVTFIDEWVFDTSPEDPQSSTMRMMQALLRFVKTVDYHLKSCGSIGNKANVLFWCKKGRHRSVAAAVTYLMWRNRGLGADEAWGEIKGCHRRFQMFQCNRNVSGHPRLGWLRVLRDFGTFLESTDPSPTRWSWCRSVLAEG